MKEGMEMLLENSPYREQILESVFENAHYCLVVVDENGIITFMNDNYCRFLGVKKQDVIGKHVTDIIENTRMHIVAKTGKEEMADLQYIRGNYMIANRIPVKSNGRVVGAVGVVLFRDTQEWMKMNTHIRALLLEVEQYRNQMKKKHGVTYSIQDIVGISEPILRLKKKIKRVAPGDATILLTGESGTGKELVAHSIHQLSERSEKPFVTVNCAAIPEHLFESELFGYVDGAFTGAKKGGKIGKFQVANGGTIFLDEVADMPLSAQVKILRVLQEGEIHPIGALHPEKVDVRVIAATNRPLEKLIEEKSFRQDLFYRINVIRIHLPSLRDRKEDIRVLSKYILHKVTNRTGRRVIDFEEDVIGIFQNYEWPGNVRELENVIESSVHLTNSEYIQLEDLPDLFQREDVPSMNGHLKELLERTERQAIVSALKKTNGDKIKAAKLLGVGKSSFYEKLKKYHL